MNILVPFFLLFNKRFWRVLWFNYRYHQKQLDEVEKIHAKNNKYIKVDNSSNNTIIQNSSINIVAEDFNCIAKDIESIEEDKEELAILDRAILRNKNMIIETDDEIKISLIYRDLEKWEKERNTLIKEGTKISDLF